LDRTDGYELAHTWPLGCTLECFVMDLDGYITLLDYLWIRWQ